MRASRRLRRRLSWFVEFLRIFYGEEDLRRRAEELVRAAPPDSLDSPAKFLAFAAAVPDDALRRRLEFRAIGLLAEQGLAAIREVMDLEGEDVHLAPVIDRVHALRQIRARIARARVHWPSGRTSASVADAITGHPILSLALKHQIANAAHEANYTNIGAFLDRSNHEMSFGRRLLGAIASGELPGVSDITLADIQPFVELANKANLVVFDLLFYREDLGMPLNSDMIRELIHFKPSWEGIAAFAASLVGDGNWIRARQILLPLLQTPDISSELWMFMLLFSNCVTENRTSEVIDLLIEADLVKPWAPVYEALQAIKAGSKSQLDAIAPEIRAPAGQLFDVFVKMKENAKQRSDKASIPVDSPARKAGPSKPRKRRTVSRRRASAVGRG